MPGNGLFTTSYTDDVSGGYTYTGRSKVELERLEFLYAGEIRGRFYTAFTVAITGGVSASRQIARSVHLIFGYDASTYDSPTFQNYNRVIQEARFGIGFTPGDVPLRIW